ncbi:MAG: methylated-DNA--[protein]-cysteine S-methyltransferase [Methanomassiliicoccaceae archaeon]|nr:methylated-DNA--[protein]-cysteine S-methyltransferase [Methanomassiliicoccaceae archaeon]
MISCASLRTPAGTIYVHGTGNVITEIGFGDACADENITPVVRKAIEQLTEYIEGKRKEFDVPFTVTGSELQKDVCSALVKIPYGETRTYKDIAKDAGHPKAIRAVATAIGKNPVAVIIPCHRVIGSDGKMHGFGGGIPFKEYLLGVEGRKPRKR